MIGLKALAVIFLGIIIYYIVTKNDAPSRPPKPHIIIIMADDMGRNDVGFHGSNQIPTPNIDALAYNGIILDKFYTQFACTPSRAALLTGNYPFRYGMHRLPIFAGENRSLPENVVTMPQHFKKLGYKTHLVGKWHLGASHRRDTPTMRGFDSHFGYWHGYVGYFNYRAALAWKGSPRITGLDLHDGFEPVWTTQGKYATELFTEKALEVIERNGNEDPLFLIVGHLAAHTGWDGYELGVPNVTENDLKYGYIKDPQRRLYAGVVNSLDDSVGKIVKKLSDQKMLQNSIIFFFCDNGAATSGIFANAGSNWPLRGIKLTEFEGGVRTAAAIYSPLLQKSGYVSKQLIHLTDCLPTLYAAAGGNVEDLGTLDGINQWESLSQNRKSNRTEAVINIQGLKNTSALINGRYKFLQGSCMFDGFERHLGEHGRGAEVPEYNPDDIFNSDAHQAIQSLSPPLSREKILQSMAETDLSWCRNEDDSYGLNCTTGCLFDLDKDPCETVNIIDLEPEIAEKFRLKVKEYEKEWVLQISQPYDPRCHPVNYNDTWCTWLDDELCYKTKKGEKIQEK